MRNIKEKLIDLHDIVPETTRSEILKDVCGRQCDGTLYEGLIDAADSLEFDDQLDYLQRKWENKDLSEVHSFFVLFREHKADVIKQGMLKDTRISAGLGNPPARFTTNASKSLNALIKSGVNYQKSQLSEFINKLHVMVEEQEREFERAIIDRGKLKLIPLYQHLGVPEFKWYNQMSEQQKASHLKKLLRHLSQISKLLKISRHLMKLHKLHMTIFAYQLMLRVQVLTYRFQVMFLRAYGRRQVSC